MTSTMERREISAPRVGRYTVHIQGDLKTAQFVLLTVHDLGCNHLAWRRFLSCEPLTSVWRRGAVLHVDVPGQEDDAPDLDHDYAFPSMQSLGEDLVCVLDQLGVQQVVGLGEGAGANILARFAVAQPGRVLGLVLVHCTGTTAGVMEALKDKMMSWKQDSAGMTPSTEAYLCLHRFGSGASGEFEKAQSAKQLQSVIEQFQQSLRDKINPGNLKRFVHAFMKRSNIADHINKLKCRVLMVTGSRASVNHTVHELYSRLTEPRHRANAEMVEVAGVANVLEERPERFAESMLYFLQGLGLVSGVPMPRVRRSSSTDVAHSPPGRTRSVSMEEADRPLGIYSTSPPRHILASSPTKG